jgi:hypothetical protein
MISVQGDHRFGIAITQPTKITTARAHSSQRGTEVAAIQCFDRELRAELFE